MAWCFTSFAAHLLSKVLSSAPFKNFFRDPKGRAVETHFLPNAMARSSARGRVIESAAFPVELGEEGNYLLAVVLQVVHELRVQ